MDNAEDTIKRYQQLLQTYGFTESSLHNGMPEGSISCMLRHSLERTVAMKGNEEPRVFLLQTTGLFNKEKDEVKYTFIFVYDPADKSVDLKALHMAYKDVQHVHNVVLHKEKLITPTGAYRRLKAMQTQCTAAMQFKKLLHGKIPGKKRN